jgi:hypothetical protein
LPTYFRRASVESANPQFPVYGGTRMGFVQNCTSYHRILGDTLIDIDRLLTIAL